MRPSPTVHADPDTRLHQTVRERRAGEPRALVQVEDRRLTPPQRLVQTVQAKPGLQGVGESPRQHLAAIPIQDRRPVDESPQEPNVGNISAPYVIGSSHRHPPQQVRVEAVIGGGARQRRFGVDRRQPHLLHQSPHPLAIHRVARPARHRRHPPAAVKRMGRVFLIQAAHQVHVQRARRAGPLVPPTPAQPQQVTPRHQRQGRMGRFDPSPPHGGGFSPDFFSTTSPALAAVRSGHTTPRRRSPPQPAADPAGARTAP